jgi:hypothetical protein
VVKLLAHFPWRAHNQNLSTQTYSITIYHAEMGRVYPKGPIRKQVKEYPERGVVWERDHQDKYTRFNNPEIRSENPANSVDSFGPRKPRAVYGTPERSNARGLRHAGHSWPSVYKHTKIPIRTMKG